METGVVIGRVLAVGALVLAACRRPSEPPVARPSVAAVSMPRKPAATTPRTTVDFPTDPGELALHNLESQIDGQEALRKQSGSGRQNAMLVKLLLRHGTYTGRIADYELAEQRAEELVHDAPTDALAWLAMAMVDSTFHRFDAEAKDYDKAQELGADRDVLTLRRALLDVTRGKDLDAAYAFLETNAEQAPMLDRFLDLAVEEGRRGDLHAAARTFAEAQNGYRDVSPFPLASLYLQEGLVEQRAGSPARARELFANAHKRLPQFAQVTAHLASVLAATGDKAEAERLLEPLATADDPEYEGELAALLDESDPARASRLRADAAARYEALLAAYPLAFADHAARFYLSGPPAAQKPKRALELALRNEKNRPTVEAERLVIDAAIAGKDAGAACATAERMLRGPRLPPEAHVSAARAFAACGDENRAAAEVARVTTAR